VKRQLSYTEVSALLECQAKHDFAYVGQLAGSALKKREPHIRLREGRAWGAAVAALHSWPDPEAPVRWRYANALDALDRALDDDAYQLQAIGLYDRNAHADLSLYLADVLWDYARTAEPMHVTHPELELRVPIPSRASGRASSRYEFLAFFDGLTRIDGRLWIVEFKLRTRLSGTEHILLGRQYRFYAWAAERILGEPIAGVIVDERLNEVPKPARINKGPKVSHAKDQLTTPELYRVACEEHGEEPHEDVLDALGARKWQLREPVIFSRAEIAEVDDELRSAARLVGLFDTGELYPLRSPEPRRCRSCAFRPICPNPRDADLVDALYERRPAKRTYQEALAV
jgi:predicted DCC family thiol-disulfide oxidoreductase YuxK